MRAMPDLEVKHLKDIPGYKAILKAVLRSQIQVLVEQLSEHTGEESVILTASVNEGTLCHMGSSNGADFMDGKDEIKTQFLRHCMKKHHKKKTSESEPASESMHHGSASMGYNADNFYRQTAGAGSHISSHPRPMPLSRIVPGADGSINFISAADSPPVKQMRYSQDRRYSKDLHSSLSSTPASSSSPAFLSMSDPHPSSHTTDYDTVATGPLGQTSQQYQTEGGGVVKLDLSEVDTDYGQGEGAGSAGELTSRNEHYNSGTQDQSSTLFSEKQNQHTSSMPSSLASSSQRLQHDSTDNVKNKDNHSSSLQVDESIVKVEPISEKEMELEITGVTMPENSSDWPEDRLGYGPSTSGLDTQGGSGDNSGDQSGMAYKQGNLGDSDIDTKDMKSTTSGLHYTTISTSEQEFLQMTLAGTHTKSLSTDLGTSLGTGYAQGSSPGKALSSDQKVRPFQCPMCNKGFKLHHHLKNHMHTHNVVRAHQCEICGKRLSRLDTLQAHMRLHTGERPCRCYICGNSFMRNDLLRRHLVRDHSILEKDIVQPN